MALGTSIAAAQLLYVLVERPSLQLSRRIGSPNRSWQPVRQVFLRPRMAVEG